MSHSSGVPIQIEQGYELKRLDARIERLEAEQDNLIACVEELAEAWVPDEWRGRDGWRVRNVLAKHGVEHLFEEAS